MRLPRGSASTVLSLAAGIITAAAVAAAWFPMIRVANQAENSATTQRLLVVAQMASAELAAALGRAADPEPGTEEWHAVVAGQLEEIRRITDLDIAMVVAPDGEWRASCSVEREGEPAPDILDNGAEIVRRCDIAAALEGQVQTTRIAGARSATIVGACLALDEQNVLVLASDSKRSVNLSRARRRATSLLLALGATAGLVVIAGTRWLLSPVQELSEAAARIAAGEREVQVEPRGPEEIAQLGRAVNALASSFAAREDEIRSRLNVVTQLSSMVAHEVRNPLQSLSLLVTLARTESDPEVRDKLLGDVEAEIHVLEGVVQRFLRNSGPLQITRSRVDLVEVMKRAAAVAEPEARSKKVSLMVHAPGRLDLEIDGSLVRRAMENLLFNAIEFASQSPPGHVTASVIPQTKQLLLIVDDDGPGVPKEERERIFQPYFSSKAGGTGLGLALVKQVFDAHGGYIHCQDSPLGGARFVAGIPLPPASGAKS